MSGTHHRYPSYTGYRYPERRSLNGLAVALTVLLSIMALVCLLNAAALFYRTAQFTDAAAGEFPTLDEANLADSAVQGTGLLIVALFVVIAVVFIIWQYRHAKNAQVLSAYGLGPGWAIGGWFIPIANLVLPALQLHHSSRASRSDVSPERSALAIIVPWVIAYYGGNLLSAFALAVWPGVIETTADLEDAAASDAVDGVSSLVWLVAAILCIAMVRSLSERQDRALQAARLQAQPLPSQPDAGPQHLQTGHQPEQTTRQSSTSSPSASPGIDTDPWRTPS